MLILNQDRDLMVEYTGDLHTIPVFNNGLFWGIKLFMGSVFLGCFDSILEAIGEMERIQNCDNPFYCISGHSDFDIVEHLMLED